MHTLKLSTMQDKGQVTIPVQLRRKYGLKKGDILTFIETENGILIAPRKVVAMKALDMIGEALKEQGVTLEDLMENGRKIRQEQLARDFGL